ncbi:serine hydrolase domain-containing protein [Streptomyces hiroshimensis]|uniref:Peptidase n=1 Tax=Streptomyces hiroshimensis TaxID=66424 RepID=A0ABQ2YKM4_9ACTN|nr:serine hydrolase domain-containing protein [Streptomyces hiroshimensis]GGX84918.1 peptidase [Streptomyces hiroshimensis]
METLKRKSVGRGARSAVALAVALAAALTAGTAGVAGAATPRPDKKALEESIAGFPNADVNGALVRVAGPGGHWWGTSGAADKATGASVRSDSSFRIGSITKLFTGTVLLQLAAERQVDLDAPVRRYAPGLLPDAFRDVKVAQLLDHTSGLPTPSPLTYGDGSNRWFVENRFRSWTPTEIVKAAVDGKEPAFPPGKAQQYNGINTHVAGLIIERVTGRTYAEEVRDRITRPLGLRHTYVPAADDVTLPQPHAHGYRTVDGSLVDVTEQSPSSWAEGGMISTAADLDRFITALLGGRLLPPSQQSRILDLPDVPNAPGNHHCASLTDPADRGKACFSRIGLMRTTLPDGTVVWGKTGSEPGYTNGVFVKSDLSRRVVYSLNYNNPPGSSELKYVLGIAKAAFSKPRK